MLIHLPQFCIEDIVGITITKKCSFITKQVVTTQCFSSLILLQLGRATVEMKVVGAAFGELTTFCCLVESYRPSLLLVDNSIIEE